MTSGLAPRRKVVVALPVVLALLLALGLAARAGLAGGSGGQAFATQDRSGPVILVPGYGGSPAPLGDLAGALRASGRAVQTVVLPGGGTADLRTQAEAVADAVRAALGRHHVGSVDLVGYSAGGVAVRLYVRQLGGARTVRRVVMLGTPNHGTDLAAQADALVPGVCTGECAQLLPGSPLLDQLNQGGGTSPGPEWLSLWSAGDTTVTPPSSASLPGATDVALQSVCPAERATHAGLPSDRLAIGIVLAALGPHPIRLPTTGQCQALRVAGARFSF